MDSELNSKAKLVNFVSVDLQTTKGDAKLIVESVIKAIRGVTIEDKVCRIPGLGVFSIMDMAGRVGRNPKTGEPAVINPSKRISFKAAATFKSEAK